jgi:hypothetical protein
MAAERKGDEAVGLDEAGSETLVFVSQEKEKFEVPKRVALQSVLVGTMAEGIGEAQRRAGQG